MEQVTAGQRGAGSAALTGTSPSGPQRIFCHQVVSRTTWLAQELFTFEAHNNSRRFRIVTDRVAAVNWFTASDLLEQLAIFNVLCQRHKANRDTLHLCSGWTTGLQTVLTLRGVSGSVPALGALEAAILLLHSL